MSPRPPSRHRSTPAAAAVLLTASLALAACQREAAPAPAGADTAPPAAAPASAAAQTPAATAASTAAQPGAAPLSAGAVEFPPIPRIVVPEILGVGPAQRALAASLEDVIDPIAGITVKPARCQADGALINDSGVTSVDAQGQWTRNDARGQFSVGADGSGSANYEGGQVAINADGSGSINGDIGGQRATVSVEADGSGSYNGREGQIALDGRGGGTWNGPHGQIVNNGDGSGSWNGPQGQITIEADGSGTWRGPHGSIVNNGDGTGLVGTPGVETAMAPIPPVAPAGRFPPLGRFAPPGAPCGVLITLNDRVLFDFDKDQIRPDAARVLDALAQALAKLSERELEIRGHTDAKGSDEYNLDLSQRRAQSVLAALRQRGAAQQASAQGYGEAQPVAPNESNGRDDPAGRQLNRRVEIYVRG